MDTATALAASKVSRWRMCCKTLVHEKYRRGRRWLHACQTTAKRRAWHQAGWMQLHSAPSANDRHSLHELSTYAPCDQKSSRYRRVRAAQPCNIVRIMMAGLLVRFCISHSNHSFSVHIIMFRLQRSSDRRLSESRTKCSDMKAAVTQGHWGRKYEAKFRTFCPL